jgi:hypothetical protein
MATSLKENALSNAIVGGGTPLEFRNYVRRATIDDVKAGIQPIKIATGPRTADGFQASDLFVAVGLQWRYQETVHVNGIKTKQWSPWMDVPLVREGDDA